MPKRYSWHHPPRPVTYLQWCPGCGRQVAPSLELCEWCEWETPDESDAALKKWNALMEVLGRPWLKDKLHFGHGCGCICPACREQFHGHPGTCPIHLAVHPNVYEVVMMWALQERDKMDPEGKLMTWLKELTPWAREVALHMLEVIKNAEADVKGTDK